MAIEKVQEEKLWDLYLVNSILAGSEYPTWEKFLKDVKNPQYTVSTEKSDKEVKEIIDTATKIFKR